MLRDLDPVVHDDLVVGSETGDDAAVWRLSDERALVATADFITPVVDDARLWGRIAATNSISDVYAMGGRPLFALNLVCWNADDLPTTMLADVLSGAADVASSCGYVTVGGHTVDDPEPKFGLAVVGEAHPDHLLRNSGLRPGDTLVLTKPLGTGVIATAVKNGAAPRSVLSAAVAEMTRTNAAAAAVALEAGATGGTDVTGFGLLGHLSQMCRASSVDGAVDAAAVPLIEGARELAAAGHVPGGTRQTLSWLRDRVDGEVDEIALTLLADAQTSGGLVFGLAPGSADEVVTALRASGHTCAAIGSVSAGTGRIRLG